MMAIFEHPECDQILDYILQHRRLVERNERSIIVLLRENFGLSARESCEALAAAQEERRATG